MLNLFLNLQLHNSVRFNQIFWLNEPKSLIELNKMFLINDDYVYVSVYQTNKCFTSPRIKI